MSAVIRCACGATWTGASRAHCSGCHLTFTTVSAFDTHRRDNQCKDPAERDLVERGGYWGYPTPEGDAEWWK